jgi:hypothetical protein
MFINISPLPQHKKLMILPIAEVISFVSGFGIAVGEPLSHMHCSTYTFIFQQERMLRCLDQGNNIRPTTLSDILAEIQNKRLYQLLDLV